MEQDAGRGHWRCGWFFLLLASRSSLRFQTGCGQTLRVCVVFERRSIMVRFGQTVHLLLLLLFLLYISNDLSVSPGFLAIMIPPREINCEQPVKVLNKKTEGNLATHPAPSFVRSLDDPRRVVCAILGSCSILILYWPMSFYSTCSRLVCTSCPLYNNTIFKTINRSIYLVIPTKE
jgi:hypothetical protein